MPCLPSLHLAILPQLLELPLHCEHFNAIGACQRRRRCCWLSTLLSAGRSRQLPMKYDGTIYIIHMYIYIYTDIYIYIYIFKYMYRYYRALMQRTMVVGRWQIWQTASGATRCACECLKSLRKWQAIKLSITILAGKLYQTSNVHVEANYLEHLRLAEL